MDFVADPNHSCFDVARVIGTEDFWQLQKRLKCTLCGARDAKLMVITPPAPRN